MIYVLFFLLGLFIYAIKIYFPNENRIDLLTFQGDKLKIRGLVSDFIAIHGDEEAVVDVDQFLTKEGDWKEAKGRVLIRRSYREKEKEELLTEIEASGIVKNLPLDPYKKPNSYIYWLRARNIAAILEVQGSSDTKKLRESKLNYFIRFLNYLRQYCSKNLSVGLSEGSPAFDLLQTMILGARQNLDPRIRDSFLYTNTIHVLSISGLHLGVILLSVIFVFGFFSIPSKWIYGMALLCIWIYACLTGLMPPILRSAIMASFFLLGRMIRKKTDLNNSLGAAAIFMLVYNPLYLFDVGFQLTFLCLVALSLLTPIIENDLKFFQKTPPEMIPLLKYKKDQYIAFANEWLIKVISGSIAVWIGVLPVIAYHFQVFSPITVVANLIAVPFVGLIMNLGFVSCLLGFIPWIALAFNTVNEILLLFLVNIMDFLCRIPGAFFFVQKPSWIWILIYFSIIFFGVRMAASRLKSIYFFLSAVFFVLFLFIQHDRQNLRLRWLSYQDINVQIVDWPGGEVSLWVDSEKSVKTDQNISKLPMAIKIKKINHLFLDDHVAMKRDDLNRIFHVHNDSEFGQGLKLQEYGVSVDFFDQRSIERIVFKNIEVVWFNAQNKDRFYNRIFNKKTILVINAIIQSQDQFLKLLDHSNICGIMFLKKQNESLLNSIENRGIEIYKKSEGEISLKSNGITVWVKQ